jgi:HEPN domain-containing protein
MSYKEADILKERSIAFFNEAKRLFDENKYDLAIFMLEQASQLLLKYKLLVRIGAYKRTHSLRGLLEDLSTIYDIKHILNNYTLEIGLLEDAYIASRYLSRRYSREEVAKVMKFVDRLFEVLL